MYPVSTLPEHACCLLARRTRYYECDCDDKKREGVAFNTHIWTLHPAVCSSFFGGHQPAATGLIMGSGATLCCALVIVPLCVKDKSRTESRKEVDENVTDIEEPKTYSSSIPSPAGGDGDDIGNQPDSLVCDKSTAVRFLVLRISRAEPGAYSPGCSLATLLRSLG